MAAPEVTNEPVAVVNQANIQAAPESQQEKPQKGGGGMKVALIILSVFLFVILAELGYLVFSGYGRTFFELRPQPTPAPIPIPQIKEDQAVLSKTQASPEEARNFADRLDYLWANKPSFLERAAIEFIVKGSLVYGKEDPGDGFAYAIVLTNETRRTLTYGLTRTEYENVRVYLANSETIREIALKDLREGDEITIKSVGNLLDSATDYHLIFQVVRSGGN